MINTFACQAYMLAFSHTGLIIVIYRLLTTSYMSNYMITLPEGGSKAIKKGTIHDPESKLKVGVFQYISSKFKPNKGEVQYFVTAGKKTFAFETEGFKKGHRQVTILEMIARYCMYLGLIGAQIHSSLPSFR